MYYNDLHKLKKMSLLVLSTILICSFPSKATASLRLSIRPIDGGNSLRFGRVDIPSKSNQEVRLTITSSDNKQYQVFQRLVEPFVNERGESLNRSVMTVSALTGSNMAGTVFVQEAERVGYSEQLIYTSDGNGDSDAFTLVYQVNEDTFSQSGNFFGKVIYTVRAVGSSNQDESLLNIFFESADDFKFSVDTSSASQFVRLNSESEQTFQGYVKFSYSGHHSGSLSIDQDIFLYPANDVNEDIQKEIVTFFVQAKQESDVKIQEPENLDFGLRQLYSSRSDEDEVIVYFQLNKDMVDQQIQGDYRGKIKFSVESSQVHEVIDVDLEISISPIFELVVDYPPEGMSFRELVPHGEAQTKEISVRVRSNLGRPYVVGQNVSGLLTNEEGSELVNTNFTQNVELVGSTTGEVEILDFVPVEDGETSLFHSDKEGSSAQFKVHYRIKPYQKMKAGDYKTAVIYSLSEV